MAIPLTDFANETDVAIHGSGVTILPVCLLFAHATKLVRLEEFNTLFDAGPPPSSVPCHCLPLVHVYPAMLHVV